MVHGRHWWVPATSWGPSLAAGTRSRADDSSIVRFVPCYGNIQGDTDSVGFTKEVTFRQKEGPVGVHQGNKLV